jgi:hypothetical protein
MEHNYHEQENEWVRDSFDLEKLIEFTSKHKVEVLMGASFQYEAYVDYKEGDGCYGTGLTILGAIVTAIKTFENKYQ